MKLANREVLDLLVFDENGKLVVKLDTLKDSHIFFKNGNYYIGISDALFNLDLQKFLHNQDNLTDFELALRGNVNTLRVGQPVKKECRLIGKTLGTDVEKYQSKLITFEAHKAEITTELDVSFTSEIYEKYDYVFKIYLDDNKDFFKLHIQE